MGVILWCRSISSIRSDGNLNLCDKVVGVFREGGADNGVLQRISADGQALLRNEVIQLLIGVVDGLICAEVDAGGEAAAVNFGDTPARCVGLIKKSRISCSAKLQHFNCILSF